MRTWSVPRSLNEGSDPKRTGTFWTASAHITLAMVGPVVLSVAWDIAHLGWIAGPFAMCLISSVCYCTSCLLCNCYRTGDSASGDRNRTYADAVSSILGGAQAKACAFIQYLTVFGTTIEITIGASWSMMVIKFMNCFHENNGEKEECYIWSNLYAIIFGITEILLSQIPDIDQMRWVNMVSVVMFFTYSLIGLGLAIARVSARGSSGKIGGVIKTQEIWTRFRVLGNIASVYSFPEILIEIQDTIRSPPPTAEPSEEETMKKATFLSTVVLTTIYMLWGCVGYAALGDATPTNLVTDFAFYRPFWLLDIANAAIFISLVGTYQIYSQPIFAFVEKQANRWPSCEFFTEERQIPLPGLGHYKMNLFRLVWRTVFVILTTVISMAFPFFNEVVKIITLGFWPLAVYFPVEMYIKKNADQQWKFTRVCLQMLSVACLVLSIMATVGSILGLKDVLKDYRPFKIIY